MQTHEFGDCFSYGKWSGKFGIQQSTGGMLTFFLRDAAKRYALCRFLFQLFGRTAFFHIMQHGGSKQNMLLLSIKRLELGQL